ncbi:hypothetical protein GJ744_002464 [Endocarpon pusillum]|uniref:Uncharacterized protein n=1 Tax=Endocarpon pusillum TaxID=364733 RepID=A0A8H7AAB9_9EURO|nr:hypothetical protein GJ744_002464 [Endocarpon pusillum]
MPVVHADMPGDVPQHHYHQPNERTVLIHSHHQPAMSKLQMGREYFEHYLNRLRTCFQQNETRSEKLVGTSNENKILQAVQQAENERLRAQNRNLKENAGELEKKVNDLKAEVSELNRKVGGLEAEASKLKRVNQDLQRQYKVMLPLTWAACQIRLGRLETVARFWINRAIHKPNDNIIRWRNSIAHDGNATLDLAAVNFMEIYPNLDGGLHYFDDFKRKLHQHKSLMKEQFGYGILKVTQLIENKNVMELLTARGTIWGNKAICSSVRSDFLVKTDKLLTKYEAAASAKTWLDPFHENGPLAAELEEIKLEADELLAGVPY